LHAEVKTETRGEILPSLAVEPVWARRWLGAMRLARGARMPDEMRFAIDPTALVATPVPAIIDEPIGIYLDLSDARRERLTTAEAASIETSLAAHRSAFGDHAAASTRCDRALDLAHALDAADAADARRLCAAVALRGRDLDRARDLLAEAPSEALDRWLTAFDESRFDAALWEVTGAGAAGGLEGPALARALWSAEGTAIVRRGALPVLFAAAGPDPALFDWLREAYPGCELCDFYDQLEVLVLRSDAAQALADTELEMDLDPIVARYRAVFETRPLALALRAGRTEEPPPHEK
jgi:hypothetical protein